MNSGLAKVWTAGALALAIGGCTAVGPAPERDLGLLLRPRTAQWQSPLRLTSRAAGTLEGDYHGGRRRLAFASRETGDSEVWLQEDAPLGLEPPRVPAPHSARDRDPRLSPEGGRVVFTSTREDTTGDIWLIDLRRSIGRRALRAFAGGNDLRKLTGPDMADGEPCWHPDGGTIFLARSPLLRGEYDIWQLDLGDGSPTRLTTAGGQMPDCSPDGRHVAFVSSQAGESVSIYVMRLADKAVARLTAGPCIDLAPCWSLDGKSILFSRYGFDMNRDGYIDRSDAASIFSVSFDAGIFTEEKRPPARQLTSYAFSDAVPRPAPGGFLFTSDRVAGGERQSDTLNLWALPMNGEAPAFDRTSEFLEFARSQERVQGADAWRRLLAWQNVLWAARESHYSGRTKFDLPAWGDTAEAWLRTADLLVQLGHPRMARQALSELLVEFPASAVFCGLARARLLALARDELAGRALQEAAGDWAEHLSKARRLLADWTVRMETAEGRGDTDGAHALGEVCALAQLEIGLALRGMNKHAEALAALGLVGERYPDHAGPCARALFATAEVFGLLGDPETVRETHLRLLRAYPDAEPYASRAAALVVDSIVADPSQQDRVAALRTLIEQHAAERVLPALAHNRIGDLFYQSKDYYRARKAYQRTIEDYPYESLQVAVAHLALAAIQTDQQDFGAALETYRRLHWRLTDPASGRPELLRRALDGYVDATLRKARKELDVGDVKLALSTYSQLEAFDPSLAAGHRGVVDCLYLLGRNDEAILRYRAAVERDGRDDVAHFALARAYSYYGPQEWVGSPSGSRRRAAIDREALKHVGLAILLRHDVSYYHQLRGFLFSRIALATDNDEARVQTLDSYLTGLGLSVPAQDGLNHANLLFNVAEAYMLVGQDENASEYYGRAVAAGFSLKGKRGEAALEDISRSAISCGSYRFAAQMLRRALDGLSGPLPDDAKERRSVLVRRARLLDQVALAYYLDGDHAAAADYYRRNVDALGDLILEYPARRTGYMRNLIRAQRNQALNIYLAVQHGALEPGELQTAYRLLLAAVDAVEQAGVVEQQDDAPGIITIDIQVAVGGAGGLAKFDLAAEKRLLYTYLGLISAEAGDYGAAAEFLRGKLSLYPELPEDTEERAVFTEQGIVWSQLAAYLARAGDLRGAADAFAEAMTLEHRAGNLQGEMADCFSLGRIALRLAQMPPEKRGMAQAKFYDWCVEVVGHHRRLLAASKAEDYAHLAKRQSGLSANLIQLLTVLGPIVPQESPHGEGE